LAHGTAITVAFKALFLMKKAMNREIKSHEQVLCGTGETCHEPFDFNIVGPILVVKSSRMKTVQ